MLFKYNVNVIFGFKFLHMILCQEIPASIQKGPRFLSKIWASETSNCHNQSVMYDQDKMLEEARRMVPPLTFDSHKGQAGRIGIIGGSEEYTGAPYFSGISALKVGADLSHVFCMKEASPIIKSYSPELIVHPLLNSGNPVEAIKEWLPRLHSVVIGPGLGRLQSVLDVVKSLIADLRARSIPIVIDADGLFLVAQDPSIIKGYHKAILTPNAVEFKRLCDVFGIKSEGTPHMGVAQLAVKKTIALSNAMEGVTILHKGKYDIIAFGDEVTIVEEESSPRRCGGQGDLLSGAAGVFTYWSHQRHDSTIAPTLVAGYAASILTKRCGHLAFKKYGRSTTTTDLINEINPTFNSLLETQEAKL
ncbi:ATP-dependent (S)-NAD(P)H-hydrate dehydratase-like [Clavelina lepadiformis]|uniref:ATP-dependent (S)-NAD(P)H-hydrate dehydratase n=1 Tax=Clavelina lepadiformis TaxID=159417 RepID=A0ABP0FXA7_CLALP